MSPARAGWWTALRLGALLLIACLSANAAAASPAGAATNIGPLQGLQAVLAARFPAVKAVLIQRSGRSVFEFYKAGINADTRLPLHSMTKSVLSALLGIAIGAGDLGLDQTVGDVLPEANQSAIDPRVRAITVRQLMTMTAGLDAEAKPPDGMSLAAMWRWSLSRPILSPAGREFRYDNFGANLLSVILTKQIGQSAASFAQKVLFGPMEITNLTWLDDGDGHSVGAYGLWLTARDMAKIGTLFLRHGRWNGRQIVPEGFVAEAIRKHNEGGTPFRGAYGYLWWIKPTKTSLTAFFAAGSDGQAIFVVPKLDLVVVVASDKSPEGGVVAFVNDVILPVATRTGGLSAPDGR